MHQELLDSNNAELGPENQNERNEQASQELTQPQQHVRSIESIWPKHECGKSESAAAISACACGAAIGMLTVFGLCNF